MITLTEITHNNKAMLSSLEENLGYSFKDPKRLQRALIHSSFTFENAGLTCDNEIYEFLGDAVLDLTIGYLLFNRFPEMREGELTKLRAALVNEGHLAIMARSIDLGSFLFLGKGEDASNGRRKSSILACAFEAVAGSIFLDGGYDAALAFVSRHFTPRFSTQKEEMLLSDSKSRLQELIQEKYNETPTYILENEEGPDHNKLFTVSVFFRGKALASGRAGSKKMAEQQAASAAIKKLSAELT